MINSDKDPNYYNLSFKTATIDATSIAIENKLGSKMAPIVNTSMLGAFAKISGSNFRIHYISNKRQCAFKKGRKC